MCVFGPFALVVLVATVACTTGLVQHQKTQLGSPLQRYAPELGFSVEAPAADGVPHDAGEFIRGSVARAEAKGWKVYDVRRDPTDIPLPGWVRYSYRADASATGPTCTLVGYVGTDGAGRTIAILHLAAGTSEPPEFAAFVRSFRLHGVTSFAGGDEIWFYLAFVGACGAVGALMNHRLGRPRVNGWRVALVVLLVWTVIATVYVVGTTPEGLSPYEKGAYHGKELPTLLPILVAWWASRRSPRRGDPPQPPRQADRASPPAGGRAPTLP